MYNKAMMPGTHWQTGHKTNCNGGVYRQSRTPGKIFPMKRSSLFSSLFDRKSLPLKGLE